MVTIYQADIYCDDCGKAIEADLLQQGKEQPDYDAPQDTDTWPSIGHPDEATDSPAHCGAHEDCLNAEVLPSGRKIGELLSTDLTDYGIEYVQEAVAEGGEVAMFWQEQFDWIDFT